MKKVLFLVIVFLSGFVASAQIFHPVKWSFSYEQSSATEATLIFKATIEPGWHFYSQTIPPDGPIPTSFTFKADPNYSLVGKTTEEKGIEEFDKTWGFKIKYFTNETVFKQKIKIASAKPFKITGTVEQQSCNDESCLPPDDVDFTFNVNQTSKGTSSTKTPVTNSPTTSDKQATAIPSDSNATKVAPAPAQNNFALEAGCGNGEDANKQSDMSFLSIFIFGLLGGLLALLTPCVFPLIPLTVSFFLKSSKNRKKAIANAWIYAVSIIAIYISIGMLVTIIFGSDALNDLSSSGFFNILFFVIFTVFAISFFGAFEITLPSKFVNTVDQKSDRGGLIGIFFMAFTLSLVSFSCTGPIIGTLLVEAAHGKSYLGPLIGMLGFSTALALPFGFFAVFPNFLHSLPKSGGWLHTVKVSLGFVELALALKFLSNVDLAYHFGFLKREIFLAAWVIIFMWMGIYLLGKLSHLRKITVTRAIFSLLAFSFAIYLTPGLWGSPLKLVSGLPPPEFYRIWKTSKGTCPLDLACFHDYDEGMRYAKLQGKPVMIDFTGWACVNCRRMEDNVWSDPMVLKRLSEKYVLISLYVDDKQSLPEKEQHVSPVTGNKIKTIGNKWSDFQASEYNTNSQPYYVLLDNKGKPLAKPKGSTNIQEYTAFLDEGLCRYEKRKMEEKNFASK